MKDDRGLYYYPFPQNKNVRMYVREAQEAVWFRLYNAEDPDLWAQHGWIPYEAIQQAENMYTGNNFDPKRAYDLDVAKALIKESKNEK